MPTVTNRPGTSGRDDKDPITLDDISAGAKEIVDKVVKDVGESNATKQLILGCCAGWVTGYVLMKVGRVAAISVGGGVILLKVATHNGYMKINWDKVNKTVGEVSDIAESATATKKSPKFLDKVKRFVLENQYIAAGFTGGLLIGAASS